VKRVSLFLACLVTLGVTLAMVGRMQAQTAPAAGGAAPAAQPASGKIAVFNVAQIMKDFGKWQYYAVIMDNERKKASAELIKAKNGLMRLQEALERETVQDKKDQLVKTMREQRNAFEDREKQLKEALDAQVAKHLKELFTDVQLVVKTVAETYNYDIVFAYPEATTQAEADTQMYIDLKMRPQAAMPFFVNKRVDITETMISTLNTHRKAPGTPPAPLMLDKDGNLTAGAVTTTSGSSPAK